MIITISDPSLVSQLREATGQVLLAAPDGTIIGEINLKHVPLPAGYQYPISEDEMAQRRQKHRSGRTLDVILSDLEARG